MNSTQSVSTRPLRHLHEHTEDVWPPRSLHRLTNAALHSASISESNTISIWNNGKGIPVVEHKDEKMYVPALIFGHLLTSSNYDDDEKKVTGERDSRPPG